MTDRLDPHTAQRILDAMRAARDRKRYGSTEERAAECREDMLEAVEDTCKAAITEAASRPPTLLDWVRACEVSKRGPMTMGAADDAWAMYWGDAFESGLLGEFVKFDEADGRVIASIGFDETVYTTPAALTAALNALASEVPRG